MHLVHKTALMIASLPVALGTTAAVGREASAFVTASARMDAPRGFADMCRNGGPLCGDGAMVQTIAHMPTEDGQEADDIFPADATAAILPSSDIILTGRQKPICADAPTTAADITPMTLSTSFTSVSLADLSLAHIASGWTGQPRWRQHCTKASATPSIPSNLVPFPALASLPELAPLPAFTIVSPVNPISTPASPAPQPALLTVTAEPSSAFSSQPAPVRGHGRALLNLRTLQSADTYVNRRVIQRSDMQMFGRGEVWRRSGTYRGATGDCEDIAIEKRIRLIEAGFPEDRLFFAVVYRTDIALHTLLVARLDDGDYVLDSRTRRVVPWNEAPYIWVSIQNPGKPEQWFSPSKPQDRMVQRTASGVDIG